MMYWQESGRRIKAENERDAAVAKAAQERAAFEQRLTEQGQEIQALRAQIAELLEERSNNRRLRAARRRRLRDTDAA